MPIRWSGLLARCLITARLICSPPGSDQSNGTGTLAHSSLSPHEVQSIPEAAPEPGAPDAAELPDVETPVLLAALEEVPAWSVELVQPAASRASTVAAATAAARPRFCTEVVTAVLLGSSGESAGPCDVVNRWLSAQRDQLRSLRVETPP